MFASGDLGKGEVAGAFCPAGQACPARIGVGQVWWLDIIVILLLVFGIWGFLTLIGVQTRFFTRKTTRTAESMYDEYADSPGKQRRYAREHGGGWRDDEEQPPPSGDDAADRP
jgi:hypothetical protein